MFYFASRMSRVHPNPESSVDPLARSRWSFDRRCRNRSYRSSQTYSGYHFFWMSLRHALKGTLGWLVPSQLSRKSRWHYQALLCISMYPCFRERFVQRLIFFDYLLSSYLTPELATACNHLRKLPSPSDYLSPRHKRRCLQPVATVTKTIHLTVAFMLLTTKFTLVLQSACLVYYIFPPRHRHHRNTAWRTPVLGVATT